MMMRAHQVMTTPVITISSQTTLQELEETLDARKISGAPVVGRDGRLLGVVSRTDLARRKPSDTGVMDIMTPGVVSAGEEATLLELSDLMLERKIHRVLVVRDGELVGIVSSLDVIRGMRQALAERPPD